MSVLSLPYMFIESTGIGACCCNKVWIYYPNHTETNLVYLPILAWLGSLPSLEPEAVMCSSLVTVSPSTTSQ